MLSTSSTNNGTASLCASATSALSRNRPTRSYRFASLYLAVTLAVLLVPDAALTQTKSPGEQIPPALLKRLHAQYVPEDDQTQGLTETQKLRRYKSILSEGAFAEKRYAGAANLHELLYLMMLAARGRTTLEGTPESGKQLMAIAERLAAESSTPPGKRLPADLLLVRAQLDELGNAPAEVADTLDVLVARYADTSAAANALIAAVGLAQAGGARASRHKFMRILADDHIAEPGTRAFLASEGKGDSAFPSRLFTARLPLLDGGELVLPRDTMGKPTLVHFWTMERPGLEARTFTIPTGELKPQNTVQLADMMEDYPSLNIIGINLDTDRDAVENFVHQQGISWPVAFSGLGLSDPTAKNYTVIETPSYWLICPDGRSFRQGVSGSRRTVDFRGWGSYHMTVKEQLDMLGSAEARVPYYRSGAFLLDMQGLLPPVAAGSEDVYRLVFLPPTLGLTEEQKAAPLRQGLELGRQIEGVHADDDGLRRVRAWMLVASRWLATQESDANAAKECDRLAQLLLEGEASSAARLLAEYVSLSRALQTERPTSESGVRRDSQSTKRRDSQSTNSGWPKTAGSRIEGFLQSWAETDLNWAAKIFAVILATEASDEKIRMTVMRGFADGRWKDQPKLRGFLRDYCLANVDAFEAPFDRDGLGSYGGGEVLPNEPMPIAVELPRLDGSIFRLPEDAGGKFAIIQFWSVAAPPVVQPLFREDNSPRAADLAKEYSRTGNQLWDDGKVDKALEYYQKAIDVRRIDLSPNFVVVAVNLDDSRAEVEAFLEEQPEFKDWIHIFSGQGWHDPLARELDVYSLPRAVLVNREGLISRWATGGQFDTETLENQQRPAADDRRSGRERRPPASPETTDDETQQRYPRYDAIAKVQRAEIPRNLSLELGAELMIELVLVGPGEFAKGSSPEEMEQYGDEWPRRRVRLTEPWYMAVHPVTRGQFAFFVRRTGYITEAEREGHALIWTDKGWQRTPGASWTNPGFEQDDSHPVVCISFNDAYEFCQWLSRKTGWDVRLPTDAQWEFTCRVGSTTLYPWGDSPDEARGFANLADSTLKVQRDSQSTNARLSNHRDAFEFSDSFVHTSPVGRFRANALGMVDMVGNVWEWTADWLSYILGQTALNWGGPGPLLIDPVGPTNGEYKVTRGGSWQSGPAYSRSASQRIAVPTMRNHALGFRISVAVDAPTADKGLPADETSGEVGH